MHIFFTLLLHGLIWSRCFLDFWFPASELYMVLKKCQILYPLIAIKTNNKVNARGSAKMFQRYRRDLTFLDHKILELNVWHVFHSLGHMLDIIAKIKFWSFKYCFVYFITNFFRFVTRCERLHKCLKYKIAGISETINLRNYVH